MKYPAADGEGGVSACGGGALARLCAVVDQPLIGAGAPLKQVGKGFVAAAAAAPAGRKAALLARAAGAVKPLLGQIGDMRTRQLVDEAARDRGLPLAVNAPVARVADEAALPRAGDADIGEAALFLQRLDAVLLERALMRKQPFLPAGKKDNVIIQPL